MRSRSFGTASELTAAQRVCDLAALEAGAKSALLRRGIDAEDVAPHRRLCNSSQSCQHRLADRRRWRQALIGRPTRRAWPCHMGSVGCAVSPCKSNTPIDHVRSVRDLKCVSSIRCLDLPEIGLGELVRAGRVPMIMPRRREPDDATSKKLRTSSLRGFLIRSKARCNADRELIEQYSDAPGGLQPLVHRPPRLPLELKQIGKHRNELWVSICENLQPPIPAPASIDANCAMSLSQRKMMFSRLTQCASEPTERNEWSSRSNPTRPRDRSRRVLDWRCPVPKSDYYPPVDSYHLNDIWTFLLFW